MLSGQIDAHVRFVFEFAGDVDGAHVGSFLLEQEEGDVVVKTLKIFFDCFKSDRLQKYFSNSPTIFLTLSAGSVMATGINA